MSEQSVVLKLETRLDSAGAKGLKDVAKLTQDAAKEEKKYQDILKGRIDQYKLGLRLKDDLARAGIGRELTEEAKYQALLRQRIGQYTIAKRLKEDLARAGAAENVATAGGIGGMLSGAASRLGVGGGAVAITAAVLAGMSKGANVYRDTFSEGRFSPRLASDMAQHALGENAIIGGLYKGTNQYQDYQSRMDALTSQREALETQASRYAVTGPMEERLLGLRGEAANQRALLEHGFSSQPAALASGGATARAIENARAGASSLEHGDIAGRLGLQGAFATHGVESERQRLVLQSRMQDAEREMLTRRADVHGVHQGVIASQRNLSTPGLEYDQIESRRLALSHAITEEKKVQERLAAAEAAHATLNVERQQQMLQSQQQRNTLLGQARDLESSIVQREQAKLQGLQSQFGLEQPHEKAAILDLAQKFARGENLAPGEIEFAKGRSAIFGERLEAMGRAAAGPEWQELVKLLGLDRQQKEAEARREKIEGEINVTLKVDEANLRASGEGVANQLREAMGRIQEIIMLGVRELNLAKQNRDVQAR